MPRQIALKIDVDTFRGTREGVPRLVESLTQHGAGATFFFSLGPDHTGRAIKRVFRPGFIGKVSRTSVVEHYGVKTLLYGTLLPGPDIGRGCADIMRATRDAGFEVGVHCYDHIRWQDNVVNEGEQWTRRELQRAVDRFTEIFGTPPRAHAAAGWQMNRHGLRFLQHLGFEYSSDTRGTHPFIPTVNAEIVAVPQLPTTLPTLDEILNRDGITRENVVDHLLQLTDPAAGGNRAIGFPAGNPARPAYDGHVFTLHAELEGGKFLPLFEALLKGWKAQGFDLVSLKQHLDCLPEKLPKSEVVLKNVDGRVGTLAVQD